MALEGDSTDSFTPDSTFNLFTFPAASAIGTKLFAKLPVEYANMRYLRLKYTPTGGNLTAGTFSANV
ncbi:Bbp16 family capsid cement protein, partial [Burkholderia cepacia]|uniref:Bbp16 family capsid cement protein n=1 Tax=Burkholderia cepacia TaxID=292 RepID=UPI00349F7D53